MWIVLSEDGGIGYTGCICNRQSRRSAGCKLENKTNSYLPSRTEPKRRRRNKASHLGPSTRECGSLSGSGNLMGISVKMPSEHTAFSSFGQSSDLNVCCFRKSYLFFFLINCIASNSHFSIFSCCCCFMPLPKDQHFSACCFGQHYLLSPALFPAVACSSFLATRQVV